MEEEDVRLAEVEVVVVVVEVTVPEEEEAEGPREGEPIVAPMALPRKR